MTSSFISPNSKRRRLVATWTTPKSYDDSLPTSCKLNNDPMDDLGRQHWLHSNTFPIREQPMCTSCYLGQWCYYPKKAGIEWDQIQLYGISGIHYAIGYKQLGEMIIKYGSDYSTWPSPMVVSDY